MAGSALGSGPLFLPRCGRCLWITWPGCILSVRRGVRKEAIPSRAEDGEAAGGFSTIQVMCVFMRESDLGWTEFNEFVMVLLC